MTNAARQFADLTTDTIENALSYLNPNCSRDYWARIGMAVKSELGESGFACWDAWSATADGYSSKDARDTWKSIRPHGGVNIGTLIYEAQQNGFAMNDNTRQVLTAEQIEQRRLQREADAKRDEQERKRLQGEAAKLANLTWEQATPAGDNHPYLERKGVSAHGLRVGEWPLVNDDREVFRRIPNALLVPIVNAKSGKITSLQWLAPNQKSYMKDGQKKGGFHIIGTPPGSGGVLAFAEGYATAATVHQLTGWCVVVTFDAPNLPVVASALREKFTDVSFVFAADNDRHSKTGDIENPGVHYATKAAQQTHGHVIVPQFAIDDADHKDFNDLAFIEGDEVAQAQLLAHKIIVPKAANDNTAPADTEPFRVLGYDRGHYFIFQREKNQLIRMTKADMTENGFLELADRHWLGMNFPKDKALFDKSAATDWLIRAAYKAGIYDPSKVRGRGAWMDDGRVVFHFGDHLWVDGQAVGVSAIQSRYVYEMDRELGRPCDTALTDDEGQMLVDISRMFRWTKPASAALLAGFVALAPLCGALRWRPHIWITGGAGCGKTTVLNDYVHRLMGGLDIFAQGNSTEAGIRQTLRSDALPVLFDESEQNNEREVGRVQNVLSLIRQASTESAALTLKGTAGGEAMHFHIRSMFCLSSIQVGMKHQADFERLTVLALRPKRDDDNAAATWATLKDMLYRLERDETLPARLLRRSMDLLATTQENIKTFVDAAARVFGSVREGDQYGTLMAGCWSLMNSGLATAQQATELINSYDWSEYRENIELDESSKALAALLEAQIRTPTGAQITLHEAVMVAAGVSDGSLTMPSLDAKALLQRFGMRLEGEQLLLSNNSQALSDLLRGTPYQADWRGQLLRVPGVTRHAKAVRFNGVVSKCLAVPVGLLMDENLGPDLNERPF